ncbi:MAG: hypothetical protein J6S67_22950 [Methanobrevibacter sp.]|nr:hypothetical protein [Methanobrevibacter sp.]
MTKELNNFTHCSKLDLIKMYKKSRRDVRRLSRQKVELKQQIEKMKCCGNCEHRHYWGNELGCNLDIDKQFECDNNNKKYWEFREV